MMGMREFRHTVRVPYAHIDKMGFVYYANYLVYFEMARSELLREVGMPYSDMEKRGVMLPVVKAHCDYKKPAHFDDLLDIITRCVEIKGIRIKIEYVIKSGNDTIVKGYTEHVCMSPEGKVLKPVKELIRRLYE